MPRKKIYEIIWEGIYTNPKAFLIVAKNEEQALKIFYKKYSCFIPSIISFKEFKEVLGK